MKKEELMTLKSNSAKIRAAVLRVLKQKNGGHLGGSMSIVEVLSVLYTQKMKYDPKGILAPGLNIYSSLVDDD